MRILHRTLFAAAILLLSTGIVSGWTISAGDVENEITKIKNVDHAGADGLFFIRIFNGFMPIPSRFIVNHVNPNGIIEFDTSYPLSVPHIVGSIEVGPYDEFLSHRSEYAKQNHTDTISIRSGLHITTYDAPKVDPTVPIANMKTIVIHDDKQFILIIDQNSELWSAMLSAYERLNKQ